MARIRYLKPDFFKDEDLKELKFVTRLVFQGLWIQADKKGRGEDRPERLKVEIMPYDKVDIDKEMAKLAQKKKHSGKPFIVRYTINEQKYYQILEWAKHQKPHNTERESIIPTPNNEQVTVKEPLNNGYETTLKGMEKGMEKGVDCNVYMDKWNTLLPTKVRDLTSSRREHLQARIKEKNFTENFDLICQKISSSEFLMGKNERKWKATFDWIIKNDTNYIKILEDRYGNKKSRCDL